MSYNTCIGMHSSALLDQTTMSKFLVFFSFDDVVNGWPLEWRYKINSNKHELSYYLIDGIYPWWSIFLKSYSHPNSGKKKLDYRDENNFS